MSRRGRRSAAQADVDLRSASGLVARHHDGSFLSYDELADQLVPYVRDLGFTHIESCRSPSIRSMRHGVISRPGSMRRPPASAIRRFCPLRRSRASCRYRHHPRLGACHFPTDEHGLARFDGTALYEHEDPRRGFHPDWNTAIYNFGRNEVSAYPHQQCTLLVRARSSRRPARRCSRLDALSRLLAQRRRMACQSIRRP